MKKTTLSRKLILVFSAILVMVIALNVIISAFMLEKVYRNIKISAMRDFYGILKEQYAENADEETIKDTVKKIITQEGMRVFVWDKDDKIVIDSFPLLHSDDSNEPESDMTEPENGLNSLPEKRKKNQNDEKRQRLLSENSNPRSEIFIFDAHLREEDIISENEDYSIVLFGNFEDLGQKSLYLRGKLANGNRVVIQMPIATISEAVKISNTLMLAVGIIMLLIGVVVIYVTSRTIARPVKELSEIADSMKNLDFSRKYEGKRRDEIGSLGESINSLSAKLEETINELCEKNEQLMKDIELKSRIDKMRKEFIANASHELKTPVALISGYAEGLRDNVASDEQSRKIYLDVIIDETEKMDHIIHQMLDLMEIDRTEEDLKSEKISLCTIAEDVVHSCELLAKNKGVNITLERIGASDVYGDYWQIYQAVINYITNAINHADEKKIVKIKIEEIDDSVAFSVYNSGKNIPEDELNNIWERFYKVDKAHTREYGGTGLGLSIVRSVIEKHGGEYGVTNKENGVEFYFILKRRNK